MLIFDSFDSMADAERFAAAIESEFKRETHVYGDIDAANDADPFPFQLNGPVVHVERTLDYELEDVIRPRVRDFGGRFAGT